MTARVFAADIAHLATCYWRYTTMAQLSPRIRSTDPTTPTTWSARNLIGGGARPSYSVSSATRAAPEPHHMLTPSCLRPVLYSSCPPGPVSGVLSPARPPLRSPFPVLLVCLLPLLFFAVQLTLPLHRLISIFDSSGNPPPADACSQARQASPVAACALRDLHRCDCFTLFRSSERDQLSEIPSFLPLLGGSCPTSRGADELIRRHYGAPAPSRAENGARRTKSDRGLALLLTCCDQGPHF